MNGSARARKGTLKKSSKLLGILARVVFTRYKSVFEGYSAFADLVMDVAEAIDGKFEYLIDWDPKAFNSISIKEVFEVE